MFKLKSIFLKKMIYSAMMLFIILCLLVLFIKNYISHNKLNALNNNLLIRDQYTVDQIASYAILDNKYALFLELHNIAEMKKLDSIKFLLKLDQNKMGNCNLLNGINYKLCKIQPNEYIGASAIYFKNKILGYVLARKKYQSILWVPIIYDVIFVVLIVAGTFVFNFLFLFLSLKRRMEYNTNLLMSFLSNEDEQDKIIDQINIEEYFILVQRLIAEKNTIAELHKEKFYSDAKKKIAEQVAHDIRSPLAAINIAVSDVKSLPESKRVMIRNAAKRINDIANNLLSQSKNLTVSIESSTEAICPELIFMVLESIISEKRYEYLHAKFTIDLNVSSNAFNCFACISTVSFKRVLSNLINNSLEASQENGKVIVTLSCNEDDIVIEISDFGCGIPNEVLPRVTEQGFSFNKDSGAGFGLSYAKSIIEVLNGKFYISSELSIGTTVTIILPKSDFPDWFFPTLFLYPDSVIFILDDDPSIHDAWNERLKIFHNKVMHFYKSDDLIQHDLINKDNIIFLIDYELLMDDKNGLDLIKEFLPNKQATLVTSCFDDVNIRNCCEDNKIKMLPKPYVPYIPIELIKNKKPQIVLIDNDELIRSVWILAARNASLDIFTFASPNEFNVNMAKFNVDTKIYIDSELDCNVKGELYAKELYEKGFTEIHLTTGYDQSRFKDLPWIKSIIGKEPIF